MNAIILAAGQSKRLRPITNYKPKCLLKFGEKTIFDYQIGILKSVGVNQFIIVVGYKKERLIDHIKKVYPDLNFKIIENKLFEITGPAYSLWLAKKYLKNRTLYLNADVIFDPLILKKVVESKNSSVTAIQNMPWDEEEVNVILKGKRILEIGKNVSLELSNGEFIGVTKFGSPFIKFLKTVLSTYVEKKDYLRFAADSINVSIQRGGKMYVVDVSKYPAIEIDTPEDYYQAKKLWEKYKKNFL